MNANLIPYDDIKAAIGLKPKAKLHTVIKALDERGIPYQRGVNCVFTTLDALNAKIMGRQIATKTDIELL
jgi:hypothetical protein